MRLNPTTLLSMDDWLVDIHYLDELGAQRYKRIGVSPDVDEERAILAALRSLKISDAANVKTLTARRRRQVFKTRTEVSNQDKLAAAVRARFIAGNKTP